MKGSEESTSILRWVGKTVEWWIGRNIWMDASSNLDSTLITTQRVVRVLAFGRNPAPVQNKQVANKF